MLIETNLFSHDFHSGRIEMILVELTCRSLQKVLQQKNNGTILSLIYFNDRHLANAVFLHNSTDVSSIRWDHSTHFVQIHRSIYLKNLILPSEKKIIGLCTSIVFTWKGSTWSRLIAIKPDQGEYASMDYVYFVR